MITNDEFDIDTIAAALTKDGDRYDVLDADEGYTFRLRIEGDDLSVEDLEDPEVFGRWATAWDGYRKYDRPTGFTGAAVKFWSESCQGVQYWYEPPESFRKFKGSGFDTLDEWEAAKDSNLQYVRGLISWGYVQIGVVLTHERADGYTREWSAWIAGVENSLANPVRQDWDNYVASIVKDQIAEVIGEAMEGKPE